MLRTVYIAVPYSLALYVCMDLYSVFLVALASVSMWDPLYMVTRVHSPQTQGHFGPDPSVSEYHSISVNFLYRQLVFLNKNKLVNRRGKTVTYHHETKVNRYTLQPRQHTTEFKLHANWKLLSNQSKQHLWCFIIFDVCNNHFDWTWNFFFLAFLFLHVLLSDTFGLNYKVPLKMS